MLHGRSARERKLSFEIDGDANGANYRYLTGTRTVNDNAWHHVAVVRQGTSLRIYVDGTLTAAEVSALAQ